MVKHIVMWKFKEFAQGRTKNENIDIVKSRLEALLYMPGFEVIKSFEFHKNSNPKEGMFDAVIEMLFDSFDDLSAYRNHPEHKAVSSFVSLVREGRASVDYII